MRFTECYFLMIIKIHIFPPVFARANLHSAQVVRPGFETTQPNFETTFAQPTSALPRAPPQESGVRFVLQSGIFRSVFSQEHLPFRVDHSRGDKWPPGEYEVTTVPSDDAACQVLDSGLQFDVFCCCWPVGQHVSFLTHWKSAAASYKKPLPWQFCSIPFTNIRSVNLHIVAKISRPIIQFIQPCLPTSRYETLTGLSGLHFQRKSDW